MEASQGPPSAPKCTQVHPSVPRGPPNAPKSPLNPDGWARAPHHARHSPGFLACSTRTDTDRPCLSAAAGRPGGLLGSWASGLLDSWVSTIFPFLFPTNRPVASPRRRGVVAFFSSFSPSFSLADQSLFAERLENGCCAPAPVLPNPAHPLRFATVEQRLRLDACLIKRPPPHLRRVDILAQSPQTPLRSACLALSSCQARSDIFSIRADVNTRLTRQEDDSSL